MCCLPNCHRWAVILWPRTTVSEGCRTAVSQRQRVISLQTCLITSGSLCCLRGTSRQTESPPLPPLTPHRFPSLQHTVTQSWPPSPNVDREAHLCSYTLPEDDHLCDEEMFVAEHDGIYRPLLKSDEGGSSCQRAPSPRWGQDSIFLPRCRRRHGTTAVSVA